MKLNTNIKKMHSNVSYTFNENTRLQDEQKSCKHCNLHVKGRSCSRDYLIVQCVRIQFRIWVTYSKKTGKKRERERMRDREGGRRYSCKMSSTRVHVHIGSSNWCWHLIIEWQIIPLSSWHSMCSDFKFMQSSFVS